MFNFFSHDAFSKDQYVFMFIAFTLNKKNSGKFHKNLVLVHLMGFR